MAGIVVVIVVVAAVATFMVANKGDDSADYKDGAFNIVSRVNSEGSGLYIKIADIEMKDGVPYRNDTAFYAVSGEAYTVSAENAKAWGGLIFATPGVTSIQHTQIASLAQSMGLKFIQYEDGKKVPADSIGFWTNLSNYSLITAAETMKVIDGGIIWEPQYQRVIQEKSDVFCGLALTNNLFPEHTCCVIVGNHDFINSKTEATQKFLAGYVKAVDFVNAALSDKSSNDYAWLVNFTMEKTTGLSEQEVKDAFDTITYLYADDAQGSLDKLTDDISNLVTSLDGLGNITGKYSDSQKFAENFVDGSKLQDALKADLGTENSGTVRVVAIGGDIHQIALHVAEEKGFFSGINVDISYGAHGGAIAAAMQNGSADFGFIGAPPATITTINAGLITV